MKSVELGTKEVRFLQEHDAPLLSVALDPNGTLVVRTYFNGAHYLKVVLQIL